MILIGDEVESAPSSMCIVRKQDYVDTSKASTPGRRGLGVRMGTRAFFGNSQIDLNTSSQHNNSSQLNMSLSEDYSPPRSPLPEAYVLSKLCSSHFLATSITKYLAVLVY